MIDPTADAAALRPHPTGGRDGGRRVLRAAIWLPGMAVALGAAVATAHGLYEVAVAARVPAGIAWLYPLITDGLALVAYAATARLHGRARRYAWSVVVLAAGLSGLAQASLLAGSAELTAPAALRFGVGAWPAVAAAIVAHLLYLLATDDHPTTAAAASAPDLVPAAMPGWRSGPAAAAAFGGVSGCPSGPVSVRSDSGVRPAVAGPSDTGPDTCPSDPVAGVSGPAGPLSDDEGASTAGPSGNAGDSPARDRARAAAVRHAARHDELPTVRQLMALADVGRGTAADALQLLREHGTPLHLVTDTPDTRSQP